MKSQSATETQSPSVPEVVAQASRRPIVRGVATDVDGAAAFYRDVLALTVVDELDDLGAAFRLDSRAMLLDPRST
jgi:hypothetical protein